MKSAPTQTVLSSAAEASNPFPYKEYYDITNICGQVFSMFGALQFFSKLQRIVFRI
jgi:hypothetical protein